jgi:hypothetical protein
MTVEPRVQNPAMTLPGAMEAIGKLGKSIEACDLHSRILKAMGESDERIIAVGVARRSVL